MVEKLRENSNKARGRNALEDRLLKRSLDNIDTKLKSSLYSINNEINQQRRLVVMLRNEMKEIRKSDKTDNGNIAGISTQHVNGRFGSLDGCYKVPTEEAREINVAGQRLAITSDIRPQMYFWSQDASTKLPAVTGFYGYRFSFQRSFTEVKLLGQNVYPGRSGKRETQSADPIAVRETTTRNIRRIHTSVPKPAQPEIFRDETRLSNAHPPPPPTREANHPVVVVNEKAVPRLVTKDIEKDNSPLEEINLNLKYFPNEDDLYDPNRNSDRHRVKGTAPGSVRTPDINKRQKSCLAEGIFKTREEATKSHKQSMERKTASLENKRPKQTKRTDLERSYTHIPVVMTEVNRLKSNPERDHVRSGRQYTKTAYGIKMQGVISKKVFNKDKAGLPPAFRKNYSTYLKHYGTPTMEDRLAPHFNTPVSVIS